MLKSDGTELVDGLEEVEEILTKATEERFVESASEQRVFIANLITDRTVVRKLDLLVDEEGNVVELGYVEGGGGVAVYVEPTMTLGDDGVWYTHAPTPVPEEKLRTYKKRNGQKNGI